MNEIIEIGGKSLLLGFLFHGFYYFFLRRESFFRISRMYLVGSNLLLIILLTLSFFDFTLIEPNRTEAFIPTILLPEISIGGLADGNSSFNVLGLTEIFYWIGFSISIIFLVIKLLSLKNYISKIEPRHDETNKIMITKSGEPFSLFRKIYIPESYLNHPELDQIIIHEKAHIQQFHLIDNVLCEIATVIFWFNPFVYLMKKELRATHEFLADQDVLENGTEITDYQNILLSTTVGATLVFQNNFNSNLKNRIVMLVKKSNKTAKSRIIIGLPIILLATLVLGFTQTANIKQVINPSKIERVKIADNFSFNNIEIPIEKTEIEDQSIVNQLVTPTQIIQSTEDSVYDKVDVSPEYPGGMNEMVKFISSNIIYPEAAKKANIKGVVYVSFIVEKDGSISNIKILRGIGGGCDEETIRVVKLMPKWTPGKKGEKPVRVKVALPVKFELGNK